MVHEGQTRLEKYETFVNGRGVVEDLSRQALGNIFENHYFAYLETKTVDYPLRIAENDESLCNPSPTIKRAAFFGKKPETTSRKTIVKVKIAQKQVFGGDELPTLNSSHTKPEWVLHVPEKSNFEAIDCILEGKVGNQAILIFDQVTLSSPFDHTKKTDDCGRLLLTLDDEDQEKNDQISATKKKRKDLNNKFLFHFEGFQIFWNWTLVDDIQETEYQLLLRGSRASELGLRQCHHIPSGMLLDYLKTSS